MSARSHLQAIRRDLLTSCDHRSFWLRTSPVFAKNRQPWGLGLAPCRGGKGRGGSAYDDTHHGTPAGRRIRRDPSRAVTARARLPAASSTGVDTPLCPASMRWPRSWRSESAVAVVAVVSAVAAFCVKINAKFLEFSALQGRCRHTIRRRVMTRGDSLQGPARIVTSNVMSSVVGRIESLLASSGSSDD
jgi:hypothetical protein